jgi:hypothetical protein
MNKILKNRLSQKTLTGLLTLLGLRTVVVLSGLVLLLFGCLENRAESVVETLADSKDGLTVNEVQTFRKRDVLLNDFAWIGSNAGVGTGNSRRVFTGGGRTEIWYDHLAILNKNTTFSNRSALFNHKLHDGIAHTLTPFHKKSHSERHLINLGESLNFKRIGYMCHFHGFDCEGTAGLLKSSVSELGELIFHNNQLCLIKMVL